MLAILLFLVTASSVFAQESDSDDIVKSGSVSGVAYENPILQAQNVASSNYGDINISDNLGMFTASAAYSSSDWDTWCTTPLTQNDYRVQMYGVVKCYVSKTKEDDGGRIIAAENDSNIKGRFYGVDSGGTTVYYHSGINKFKWFISTTHAQASASKWSPSGTTTITAPSTLNWSIAPQILGNSLGSISGSFQGVSDKVTGFASGNYYQEEWSRSSGSVEYPDPVYLGGAVAWYIPDGEDSNFNWTYSWTYKEYKE